jgi:hypothetical protein
MAWGTAAAILLAAAMWPWVSAGQAPEKPAPAKEESGQAGQSSQDLSSKFSDEAPAKTKGRGTVEPVDELDQADTEKLLTRRTEAAIDRGLRWLRQAQGADGRWEGADTAWTAYNAFSMIAFMLNGHFPNKKQPYGECMTKSLDALLKEAISAPTCTPTACAPWHSRRPGDKRKRTTKCRRP